MGMFKNARGPFVVPSPVFLLRNYEKIPTKKTKWWIQNWENYSKESNPNILFLCEHPSPIQFLSEATLRGIWAIELNLWFLELFLQQRLAGTIIWKTKQSSKHTDEVLDKDYKWPIGTESQIIVYSGQ